MIPAHPILAITAHHYAGEGWLVGVTPDGKIGLRVLERGLMYGALDLDIGQARAMASEILRVCNEAEAAG